MGKMKETGMKEQQKALHLAGNDTIMIERDINIEFESEQIAIEAVICFTRDKYEYDYQPEYTQIKRIVNLKLNEGAPPIPTTMDHYKMLEKHWEDNDVYNEI